MTFGADRAISVAMSVAIQTASGIRVERELDEGLGPAMRDLTVMQRRFVIALVTDSRANGSTAAAAAGYAGDAKKMAEIGSRLRHHPKVVAAIHEEALKRLLGARLLATGVVVEIAADQTVRAADRLKAAEMILNRTGIIEETRTEMVVTHKHDPADVTKEIIAMAKQLNLDPRALLGKYGVVLDAEFEVVSDGSSLGLEDFL